MNKQPSNVDADKYYSESLKEIDDIVPFVEMVNELKELADEGRINDMRRHLVNFTVAHKERWQLETRIDEGRYWDANVLGSPRSVVANERGKARLAELIAQKEKLS